MPDRSESFLRSGRGDQAAQRRKAFVDAASAAFSAYGYAGTTMSSIAAKVGGSKTTLWSYFPSKKDLFAAVVDDLLANCGEALVADLPLDQPVAEVLHEFAHVLMTTLIATPLLSLHRLVVGEAERFPQLAETFYDRCLRRGKARLAEWMCAKMARGDLRSGDPMRAVEHFVGLCQSGVYGRAFLGLAKERDLSSLEADIDAAIDSFGRAWQPVRAAARGR